MKTLKVLGSGCAKCVKLAENAEAAAKELGVEYYLVKVTDLKEIVGFGVMATPALVVDGQVKSVGKVLDVAELKKLLA